MYKECFLCLNWSRATFLVFVKFVVFQNTSINIYAISVGVKSKMHVNRFK